MHEGDLAAWPRPGGLSPDAESAFRRQRRVIHQKHRTWRSTMPAIDALFDDDGHRAKALAGNLATELEATLAAWARLCEPGQRPGGHSDWIRSEIESWTAMARGVGRASGWDHEANAVFDHFLGELCERAESRAMAILESRGDQNAIQAAGRLRRLLRSPLAALAGIFRPDARSR